MPSTRSYRAYYDLAAASQEAASSFRSYAATTFSQAIAEQVDRAIAERQTVRVARDPSELVGRTCVAMVYTEDGHYNSCVVPSFGMDLRFVEPDREDPSRTEEVRLEQFGDMFIGTDNKVYALFVPRRMVEALNARESEADRMHNANR